MAGLIAGIQGAVGGALSAVGVARRWNSGLCDCMQDTAGCCYIYCCTSCAGARMCAAIDGQESSLDMSLCFAILVLNYNTGNYGMLAMILRYRIVAKYNIADEGVVASFFTSTCCPLCSMCQTHRMLTDMMLWPGGTCCGTTKPGVMGMVSQMK